MKDVFLLSDENGWGLYNAAEDRWLLPSSKDHKKIESCREEFSGYHFQRDVLFRSENRNTKQYL
jgi:hypothetical protein